MFCPIEQTQYILKNQQECSFCFPDDALILQIQGTSEWSIMTSSEPEQKEQTRLADCVTAQAGDVLFVARKCSLTRLHDTSHDVSHFIVFELSNIMNLSFLLDMVTREALVETTESFHDLKEPLLPDVSDSIGIQHEQKTLTKKKEELKDVWQAAVNHMAEMSSNLLDAAFDQAMKTFIRKRVPIVHANKSHRLCLSSRVYTHGPNIGRIVVEEGEAVLYHCIVTSTSCKKPIPIHFSLDAATAVDELLSSHDEESAILVSDVWISPNENFKDVIVDLRSSEKLEIAQMLYDHGILFAVPQ